VHWSRMSHSHQSALEHLRTYGWSSSPAAFRAEDAAAMCDLIWAALGEVGIHGNDPSTRTTARPEQMKHLKADSAFRSIGSAYDTGSMRYWKANLGRNHGIGVPSSYNSPSGVNGIYRLEAGIMMAITLAACCPLWRESTRGRFLRTCRLHGSAIPLRIGRETPR
jgi:hypothetical protein